MTASGAPPVAIATKSRGSWLERLPSWAKSLVTLGALPDDPEEERLRKASLVLTASMITALAVVWVVTYTMLGLYVPAAIPFGYQMISVASIVLLARTGRFEFLRTSQLTLMLLLPVLLQWSLGGFLASSGVMLWALVSPLAALVFSPRPLPLFSGYLALTVISGVVEPFLTPAAIPEWVNVAFFVLNIGGVSTVVYFLLRYFMRGLALERQKSETLLLNVLPASIARRLKGGERPLADRFEDAAVLFADMVDFTPMSEHLTPEEVVEMLDGLFSEFDVIAERRQLEKIKTVGDAYMVVGGLPEPRPDAAEAVAEMALEMQDMVAGYRTSSGETLRLRIGIDIGPVVAGVIGRRKFTYDLWGDTVNTASRMESHGIPGQIQVTPNAYERLRHHYRFQAREPMEVKGKGRVVPYLLLRRDQDAPTQREEA
ncbi:MAG: adenylate/guanylate cyclase domain-containing protein [Actinobacteria bacterium]|nr:adenylate/guanylate cyclase domain-containing protein [Actinomycetota bacterium]